MEAVMCRLLFAIIAISAAALLAMNTPPAFARGGGHGKGGGYSAFAKAPSGDHWKKHRSHKRRWSRHHRDKHRWSRYHRHEHRWSRHDNDWRPPGWDKGKKTGWGDGDMPPGLSRKIGTQDGRDEQSASDAVSGAASDVVDRFQR